MGRIFAAGATPKPEDVVLVDRSRTAPSPPGSFVLFDDEGLAARRIAARLDIPTKPA